MIPPIVVTFGNAIGVLPIQDPNAITSPSNTTTPGVGATPKDGAGGIKPPEGVTGSVVPPVTGSTDAGVVKSPNAGTVKVTDILTIPLAKWDDYQKNKAMYDYILQPLQNIDLKNARTVEDMQLALNNALNEVARRAEKMANEATFKMPNASFMDGKRAREEITALSGYVNNWSAVDRIIFYVGLVIGLTSGLVRLEDLRKWRKATDTYNISGGKMFVAGNSSPVLKFDPANISDGLNERLSVDARGNHLRFLAAFLLNVVSKVSSKATEWLKNNRLAWDFYVAKLEKLRILNSKSSLDQGSAITAVAAVKVSIIDVAGDEAAKLGGSQALGFFKGAKFLGYGLMIGGLALDVVGVFADPTCNTVDKRTDVLPVF